MPYPAGRAAAAGSAAGTVAAPPSAAARFGTLHSMSITRIGFSSVVPSLDRLRARASGCRR
jgi:hypothetical protein